MIPNHEPGRDPAKKKRETHALLRTEILSCTTSAITAHLCSCVMCQRAKYVAAVKGLMLTFLDAALDRPDDVGVDVFADMMYAVSKVAQRFTAEHPNVDLPPFPPVDGLGSPTVEPPPPSDLSFALARRVVAHDEMVRSDPEFVRTPVVRRAMYDDMVSKARALLSNVKVQS